MPVMSYMRVELPDPLDESAARSSFALTHYSCWRLSNWQLFAPEHKQTTRKQCNDEQQIDQVKLPDL